MRELIQLLPGRAEYSLERVERQPRQRANRAHTQPFEPVQQRRVQ
jgi:hypothetical protein